MIKSRTEPALEEVNFKNITLKIIGTGDIKVQLERKFKGKNIEFLGPISNSDALNEIRDSRAVITATKMYEGQPRLLNEASEWEFRVYFQILEE